MVWKNKCCRDQTKLEKLLIVFVVILLCIVLVLFTTLLSTTYDNEVCNHSECVKAASHILDFVDPTMDPCDNFYKFACGTFLKNAFTTNQAQALQHLKELMKNQLREIVLGPSNKSEKLPKSVAQQRKLYESCMNTTALDEDDNKTFLKQLDKLGGWPVAKGYAWEETRFDWVKSMATARHLGFPFYYFLRVIIHQFKNDSEPVAIKITPPYFSSRKFDSEWNEDTIETMGEIAGILGAPSVGATTELRRTMYFAEQLKDIATKAWDESENETEEVEKVAIKNLDNKYVKIAWLELLKNITGYQLLTEEDQVVFTVDTYLKDLYFLLLKTPKRIQANYMGWFIISKNIVFLSTDVQDAYAQKNNSNKTKITTRQDICYDMVVDVLAHVAEAEYIRRYLGEDKKTYIKEMIGEIKQELKEILKSNTWMDEETKLEAEERLKNLTEILGAVDLIYNVEKFEKNIGFAELNITSTKLIDMTMELYKNDMKKMFRLIHKIWRKQPWFTYHPSVEVNAFFWSENNQIILSAPILQGIIFNTKRPHYMNYGSLGSIIGHELTHGFIYSKEFTSEQLENWFTNKSISNFEESTKCFLDEYDNFASPDDSKFKNASSTLEENLADFTSRNIAYRAYKNWVLQHGYEDKLPGLSYTPNQIFWIMSSTYLCTEPRLVDPMKKIMDTSHADPQFRVNGALRNSPYFAEDFNCPGGSPMNPERKCQLFT